MGLVTDIVREMRPKQWYKNGLVFIGIIFSANLFQLSLWPNVILAFLAFCALSSSVYIINDISDIEKDRIHPVKKNRPIASGRLGVNLAMAIAFLLIFAGIFASMYLGATFAAIAALYLASSIAYNLVLKDVYLVDIFTISFGMVLRAVAGCVAIAVTVSPWLILCTFLMAIFLALAKRRHELVLLNSDAGKHRAILKKYSVPVLDSLLTITTASLIVSYSMYTFISGRPYLMLTIPFALYGLFKYTDNVYNKSMGGEPELMFKDLSMIACIVLWGITIVLVIMHVPDYIVDYLSLF